MFRSVNLILPGFGDPVSKSSEVDLIKRQRGLSIRGLEVQKAPKRPRIDSDEDLTRFSQGQDSLSDLSEMILEVQEALSVCLFACLIACLFDCLP